MVTNKRNMTLDPVISFCHYTLASLKIITALTSFYTYPSVYFHLMKTFYTQLHNLPL